MEVTIMTQKLNSNDVITATFGGFFVEKYRRFKE